MINAQQLESVLTEVVKLSKQVGNFISEQRVKPDQVELKSMNNLVTFVDKEAERMFVEGLQQIIPDAGFLTEEGTVETDERKLRWIIDPLDGTTNYLYNIPFWCTSVALFDGDSPILGVIHSPSTSETFEAASGMGAKRNGELIHVSDKSRLKDTLLATGFPYDDFGRQNEYMDLLRSLMSNTRGIRRLGSAAMDLAYVACGNFDAFYEYGLNPWDVAAGIVIVKEAGGSVSDFEGGNKALNGEEILASNTKVHKELMDQINQHF